MVSNCPRCKIVWGVKLSSIKLSWCQFVKLPDFHFGVKLSIVKLFIVILSGVKVSKMSNCPRCQIVQGVKLSGVKFSSDMLPGVKLSYVLYCPESNYPVSNCLVSYCLVSNYLVSNCPKCQIFCHHGRCQIVPCVKLYWCKGVPRRGGNQIWMLKPQVNSIVISIYKTRENRIFEFGVRLNPPHLTWSFTLLVKNR